MSEERVTTDALPAETSIGRVGLRVASIDRLAPFYREAIGCRIDRRGDRATLAAADGRVLIVLREDPDAPPRPPEAAGLYHLAIRLPSRGALGDTLARLGGRDVSLSGASDHRVSEALYLDDPAGNGIECYRDRPRSAWPRRDDGTVEMETLPLDLDALRGAAGDAVEGLPAGTDVGHVHLEVTDLEASRAFYVDALGFRPSASSRNGARFLSAGGYHHHVAINVWNGRSAPAGAHQGLDWFEVHLPDEPAREAATARLASADHAVSTADGAPMVTDPNGIEVRLRIDD